jgi:uncharacterized protein YdiU (UPF0061 family)
VLITRGRQFAGVLSGYHWLRDVQLKGAGRTPFSQRGDGRASLAPVLRLPIARHPLADLGVDFEGEESVQQIEPGNKRLRHASGDERPIPSCSSPRALLHDCWMFREETCHM